MLRTVQSAFQFTSLTDMFTQTPPRLLWEASSHMLQLMREGCSYTCPPLSIVRYSFIQLSELEQCRVKKLAQGFNTAAQDSNPGSLRRESEALPLSHCAIQIYNRMLLYPIRIPYLDPSPGIHRRGVIVTHPLFGGECGRDARFSRASQVLRYVTVYPRQSELCER